MTNTEKISQIQSYQGKFVNCKEIFYHLCQSDFPAEGSKRWKYDLEESDLMQFFSRTWTTENSIDSSKEEFKEGFKAFLYFEEYICAPPYGEQAYISKIFVAKFNKADLSKKVGKYAGYLNDKEPGYWHNVYGDNDWRVAHTPITWENIPENILSDLYNELSKALEFAIVEEE